MSVTVLSPLGGQVVELKDVPDIVFSTGIFGPGLAIEPKDSEVVVAPMSGVITKIFPHAFMVTTVEPEVIGQVTEEPGGEWAGASDLKNNQTLQTQAPRQTLEVSPEPVLISEDQLAQVLSSGISVLVHLGIDTVKMHGNGFKVLAQTGQLVQPGDPIVKWDPDLVRERGYHPVCPIVVVDNQLANLSETAITGQEITPGQLLYQID